MYDDYLNVRVSSLPTKAFPQNTIADFKVDMPRTLDFKWVKNPTLTITTMLFENTWSILPEINLDFYVHITEDSGNKRSADGKTKTIRPHSHYFKFPQRRVYDGSCKSIFQWFIRTLPKAYIDFQNNKDGGKIVFKKSAFSLLIKFLLTLLVFHLVLTKLSTHLICATHNSN